MSTISKLLQNKQRHLSLAVNLLLLGYVARRTLFSDWQESAGDFLVKLILSANAVHLAWNRRKYVVPLLTVLIFIRARIAKTQKPQSVYQHLMDLFFFKRIGLNLPPNGTGTMLLNGVNNGPWKRHISELRTFETLDSEIYGVYAFGKYLVNVSDPKLVEQVLLDKEGYPTRGPTGFSDLTQLGLLGLPTGDMHSRHRRIIGAFMSNTWLQAYSLTIERETKVLVEKWKTSAKENKPRNANYDLSMLTLEVIMKACTGNSGYLDIGVSDVQDMKESDNELAKGLDFALKEIVVRTAVPLLNWFPSPSRKWLHNKFLEMWAKAKSAADVIALKKDAPLMIYTALKEAKGDDGKAALTSEEIHDELMTIRGAGHETTSNTLSWALYLLWQNPDKLKLIQQEVDSVVAGECVTYEESKSLRYTRNVIYETLRLYPTVPSFPREAKRGLKLGEYDIPAKTLVFVSQNALNKSPKIWSNPLLFEPERFDDRGDLAMSKPVGVPNNGPEYGFVPFGAGSRTCIGQRLAVLEALQILGSIVKIFTWELKEGTTVHEVADVTLGPKEGLYMHFALRKS